MRIRLLTPCFINGTRHNAGDIVVLPDGVRGPHRAIHKTEDRVDYDPANETDRLLAEVEDVPLYEEVTNEPEPNEPQKPEVVATPRREPFVEREPEPTPVQIPGEVRQLTHIEERDRR